MEGSKTKQEISWKTELPDDLIFLILSKIHDTKTLIRCYSVSKNMACLVSLIDTISPTITPRSNDSLACAQHDHIPEGAFLGFTKVFANLKSLEIRLCPCCSPPLPAAFRMEFVFGNDNDFHWNRCLAFEFGSLSRTATALSLQQSHQAVFRRVNEAEEMAAWGYCKFPKEIFKYRPKTLSSLVISLAKQEGFGSPGKSFMQKEELEKFDFLVWKSGVNERWVKDPENVPYWFKKPINEIRPEEMHWIASQHLRSTIAMTSYFKNLLDACNDDDD